jgi:hypothetical protein
LRLETLGTEQTLGAELCEASLWRAPSSLPEWRLGAVFGTIKRR